VTDLVPLGEVALINPRPNQPLSGDDIVSFLGMADVETDGTTSAGTGRPFSEVSKGYTQFESGDILVAKITPCFENGKIAQAVTQHFRAAGSTEFHVIRPRTSILDSRYLHHFLRQSSIRIEGERRMTGSAGQRRVPYSYLAKLRIPLLPIDEQRQVAEVLDRVAELIAKRRKSVALLEDFAQSIFLEIFGETVGRYESVTVGDLTADRKNSIRTGPFGSQLLHGEFAESGIPVLGIDNAVNNEFRWSKRRFITGEKYQKLARYRVFPGDVIITIMGTCGRCAVVPENIGVAINTKHLCCISLDRSKCLPEFLHSYFLMHPIARSYLQQTAKGAIMSGLNMNIIKAMPVALPPLGQQERYVAVTREVQDQKLRQLRQLAELEELFDSLQAKAFRGEL
jgi:type I restriction enzyme S subunit